MNAMVEKKDGFLRLDKGVIIPCDTTLNTNNTFNTKLVGKVGDEMYALNPDWDFYLEPPQMIISVSQIQKCVITKISYATDCGVCFYGITLEGEEICRVQQLFFKHYVEAVDAVNAVNDFYSNNEPSNDWLKDYESCVKIFYCYEIQFPVKPQDTLIEGDYYYSANRVIAYIYQDGASIHYQGHDAKTYKGDKEVHSIFETQDKYEIVSLMNQPTIDI